KLHFSIRNELDKSVETAAKTVKSPNLRNVKVIFFEETSFQQAREILLTHGAILEATQTEFDFRQTIDSVTLPADQIESLAEEDSVFLITKVDPPAEPANINAQDTSNVDEIQPGGITDYDLDGTGVTVGMWDSGPVRVTHEQIRGRATQEDSNSTGEFNDHACHVAGIIAGDGTGNIEAEGMAPNATLLCWDTRNDLSEIDANAHRISVSNHSYIYGTRSGHAGNAERTVYAPYDNGNYNSRAQSWDQIVLDHDLIVVRAAGNGRRSLPPPSEENQAESSVGVLMVDEEETSGYDTILPSAVAKNIITVGAIHDLTDEPPVPDDNSMTDFSSWGPADDGRIKPDVVANGSRMLSMGPDWDNAYFENSGTSMSTPVVSGIAACLVQQFRRCFAGEDPTAATMKGTLIHTVRDGGSQRGPDYRFGWGLVDGRAAAEFIANHGIDGNQIILDSFPDSFLEYPMVYVGTGPIKATLVWTDPPGIPISEGQEDDTPNLVNDLDLYILGPDRRHYPWTLDPSNPTLPARQHGENHRDNVEQVFIESPVPGPYTIWIDGQVNLGSSQEFALCISGFRPGTEGQRVIDAEIVDPAGGEAVSGETPIRVHVLDDLGTSRIVLKVDGVVIDNVETEGVEGEIEVTPPQRETTESALWDTTTVSNGSHTIEVTATSIDGLTCSRSNEVFVCNENEGVVSLALDGTAEFESISPSGDEDWFSFKTPASATYTVETLRASNLADHPDTAITLYGRDSREVPIFANDDGGMEGLSNITQVLEGNRVYHVKVTGHSDSTGFYRIRLRTTPNNESLSTIPLEVNGPMVSSEIASGSEHWYTFRTTALGIHFIKTLRAPGHAYPSPQILLYKADDEKDLVASTVPGYPLSEVLADNQVYLVKVISSNEFARRYLIGVDTRAAPRVYIRSDAVPGGDGLSWEGAFNSINGALEVMWATGEIWVVAGRYPESVEMKPGIALYGGFVGMEKTREARDWTANETIIDAAGLGTAAVVGANDAILDGFTLTGASESGVSCVDGSSPTLVSCTITGNLAYGVSCDHSSPTLTNCTITGNSGSGVNCSGSSSPTLTNCTISGNTAYNGGGVYCRKSSPALINCTITGNTGRRSGGVYCNESSPIFTNCTISGNVGLDAGGLLFIESSPTLTNCILWNAGAEIAGDAVVSYSCVQHGWPGEGNIKTDPQFVDPANGDYYLQNGSPCIDKGLASVAPATDLDGRSRPGPDGLVDMGAYESPPEYEPSEGTASPRLLYVRSDAPASGDGLSWERALNSIGAAMRMSWVSDEVWVAAGRYREAVRMEPGVALYGGFMGIEQIREERDWVANETIIDATGLNVSVVIATSETVLDGFTLTGGNSRDGGGVYCGQGSSVLIANCTITGNNPWRFGGVWCAEESSVMFDNCTISGNKGFGAGGVYCSNSSATFFNCRITENTGTDGGFLNAGGVLVLRGALTMINCVVAENICERGSSAGGVYYMGGSPVLTNCIITKNVAGDGFGGCCFEAGFSVFDTPPQLTNCTISDNIGGRVGG
ncbi:MAG: S8 family serine peptidase, partial [bacterium]